METSTDEHSLRSQVGMGSESDCLFGQFDRILWISDSETGVKTEKPGGVAGEEGECGDDVAGWLVRERRSLDILVAVFLSVARVTAGLAESNGSLSPGLLITSPAG